jgi:alkaline phosphatase
MSEKEPIGMFRRNILLIVIMMLLWLSQASQGAVKNVILMIGDGMGFEQVKAASLYAYGDEEKLPFEKYYRGEVTTHSANSYLDPNHATDSAAAATAMATGQKVKNKVISEKDGKPIPTILEHLQTMGKATGLITTVPITHATPAAFAAHTRHRDRNRDIADDYLTQSRPNILFGAYYKNGKGMTDTKAERAGYKVVNTRDQMQNIVKIVEQNATDEVLLAGLFSPEGMPWEYDYYNPIENPLSDEIKTDEPTYNTIPHLSEMTSAALSILDNDPDGFFLMVEGGKIDKAGHDNILERNVFETLEFTKAFLAVSDWAKDRDDTLIIVTADHECGGLTVVNKSKKGFMPEVFWGSKPKWHTGVNVPIYATGEGADKFTGVIDNTDIYTIIMGLVEE